MHLQEELKKDFSKALDKINVDCYSPFSTKFMEALFIGQMLQSVKLLDETNTFIEEVEDEFADARKYLKDYETYSDTSFKELALDELKHAGILIKKYLSKTEDDEIKQKLSAFEEKRLEMIKSIEKPTSSFSMKSD